MKTQEWKTCAYAAILNHRSCDECLRINGVRIVNSLISWPSHVAYSIKASWRYNKGGSSSALDDKSDFF